MKYYRKGNYKEEILEVNCFLTKTQEQLNWERTVFPNRTGIPGHPYAKTTTGI